MGVIFYKYNNLKIVLRTYYFEDHFKAGEAETLRHKFFVYLLNFVEKIK